MHNKETYLVYKLTNTEVPPKMDSGNPGFTILRPTIYNVLRFAKSHYPFMAWWLFHRCGVFHNKCFIMLCYFENNQIVHRTCVFPSFYKFPFMNKEDLQVGEIWTREDYRNRGMATRAIKYILNLDQYNKKTFWYVVGASNSESIRLAERSGFSACCTAHKKNKMGISFIGNYEISTKHYSKPEVIYE